MKLKTKDLRTLIGSIGRKLIRYRIIIFIILIGCVYSYVLFTINSLSDIQPSTNTVNTELSGIKTPRLDQAVVKQLEALRDNSVSVKTLFQQARDNPFNE